MIISIIGHSQRQWLSATDTFPDGISISSAEAYPSIEKLSPPRRRNCSTRLTG
jgi:hypothetical protein